MKSFKKLGVVHLESESTLSHAPTMPQLRMRSDYFRPACLGVARTRHVKGESVTGSKGPP